MTTRPASAAARTTPSWPRGTSSGSVATPAARWTRRAALASRRLASRLPSPGSPRRRRAAATHRTRARARRRPRLPPSRARHRRTAPPPDDPHPAPDSRHRSRRGRHVARRLLENDAEIVVERRLLDPAVDEQQVESCSVASRTRSPPGSVDVNTAVLAATPRLVKQLSPIVEERGRRGHLLAPVSRVRISSGRPGLRAAARRAPSARRGSPRPARRRGSSAPARVAPCQVEARVLTEHRRSSSCNAAPARCRARLRASILPPGTRRAHRPACRARYSASISCPRSRSRSGCWSISRSISGRARAPAALQVRVDPPLLRGQAELFEPGRFLACKRSEVRSARAGPRHSDSASRNDSASSSAASRSKRARSSSSVSMRIAYPGGRVTIRSAPRVFRSWET